MGLHGYPHLTHEEAGSWVGSGVWTEPRCEAPSRDLRKD